MVDTFVQVVDEVVVNPLPLVEKVGYEEMMDVGSRKLMSVRLVHSGERASMSKEAGHVITNQSSSH